MQKLLISLLACASLFLPGCASVPIPGVHQIDIQQGNVIDQEMVNKLKPGMDKSQVRFALGTPTIVDVFHQERWDYIYSLKQGSGERQQRHITLFFEGDKLARVEGDVQPAAGEREEPAASKETTVTVQPTEKKKGFFGGLKSAIGLGDEEGFARTPDSAKSGPDSEPGDAATDPASADKPTP